MQMYVYVHDAILRAVAGYEERAKQLDRDSADDVAAFATELDWFHTMVKGHEKAELLYRQSVALNEHMRLHISKENELLLPKLEAEFNLDEQARIAGTMAGMFDPPMMGALVGWMYDGQDAQDREGMIRFLQRALPPEAFSGLAAMLAAKDASTWAEVQRRVPELA
jgi:hypothetical protein